MKRHRVRADYQAKADPAERDGLRLLKKGEKLREVKVEALRRDIAEGLNSGESEDMAMETILAEARRERKNVEKHRDHGA